MEIFPYIADVVMFAFACYWSAANIILKPGDPTFGLFRYREDRTKDPASTASAAAAAPKQPWKR